MYFKELELTGFKSFSEKTKLKFEPGVTAVVGPNGCGKSNIADGIRWVLGEQSPKSLRGAKMEDVIFNGTDTRDPLNMAEVSLTLSNKERTLPIDYDEVTITRRLFRSGESEYLLNKNIVRLKDVHELLMGTGVGTESYSIIEQGKMDLVLSSKPEDRRFIFEEASGITRYKSKKKEALRKLEHTEENLVRINDIITEVKRQINSITRQVKKAERYRGLFEELKERDLRLSFFEHNGIKDECSRCQSEIQGLKNAEAELTSSVNGLEAQISGLRNELTKVDMQISECQAKIMRIDADIGRGQDKKDINAERIREIRERSIQIQKEKGALKGRIDSVGESVGKLRIEFGSIDENVAQKKENLNLRQGQLKGFEENIRRNEKEIDGGKLKVLECTSGQSKARNELSKLGADIQNKSARNRRLNIEKEKVGSELDEVNGRLDDILRDVAEAERILDTLKGQGGELKACLEKKEAVLDQLQAKIKDAYSDLLLAESRLEFLENLKKQREGFSSGVKTILNSIETGEESLKGVLGVLADLLDVKNGYEVPVEAALGDNVQSVLVKTRQDAVDAAEFLKAKGAGMATFMILDEFAGSTKDESVIAVLDPSIHRLTTYVDADERTRPILKALLKDVYLVDGLEEAQQIMHGFSSNSPGSAPAFVTPLGEMLTIRSLRGGAGLTSEDASLIGRAQRIASTHQKVEKLKIDIEHMEKELVIENGEFSSLQNEFEGLEQSRHTEEITLADKNAKEANTKKEKGRLDEEMSLLSLEIDEIRDAIEGMKRRRVELEDDLKRTEEMLLTTQNLITTSQDQIKENSSQREEM
ncbi:MAG: chromosome segregation protein SMC, partial [Candidatus Omnitrophica bacterium]|nr:chromosome segregation protein SMC [Candidatus Omnitrophota bacterium]